MEELARRRRARGLELNHPEAVTLLCDEMLERARDGVFYAEVVAYGYSVLNRDDVMEGVPETIQLLQLECMFRDGTKLISLRNPTR